MSHEGTGELLRASRRMSLRLEQLESRVLLAVPIIGSLADTPDPVNRGNTLTLTAANVSDPDGKSITEVRFYRSVDAIFGNGDDVLLGLGTQISAKDWRYQGTASWTAGNYNYFARARDADSEFSAAKMTSGLVNDLPVIASLTANPTAVAFGDTLVLTANGVTDTYGQVTWVDFYHDANNDGVLTLGTDTFLGRDTDKTDGWSWTGGVTWVTGSCFAVPRDLYGATGSATWGAVNQKPTVQRVTNAPNPVDEYLSVTFTAINVTDPYDPPATAGPGGAGVVTSVQFWRDTENGDGSFNPLVDVFLGVGTQSGANWTLTLPATSVTWNPDNVRAYFARAVDAKGAIGNATATLNQNPRITELVGNPSPVTLDELETLQANGVRDADGYITGVSFWDDDVTVTDMVEADDWTWNFQPTWRIGDIVQADFNQDGYMDVAVAVNATAAFDTVLMSSVGRNFLAVLINDTRGNLIANSLVETSYTEYPSLAPDIATGDFNNDGYPDVAMIDANFDIDYPESDAVFVSLNTRGPGAYFTTATSYPSCIPPLEGRVSLLIPPPPTFGPDSITSADFNGDGTDDIAVASSTWGEVTVLFSDATGVFTVDRTYSYGFTQTAPSPAVAPMDITAADFDQDGHVDLATVSMGGVLFLWNDGAGRFDDMGAVLGKAFETGITGGGRETASLTEIERGGPYIYQYMGPGDVDFYRVTLEEGAGLDVSLGIFAFPNVTPTPYIFLYDANGFPVYEPLGSSSFMTVDPEDILSLLPSGNYYIAVAGADLDGLDPYCPVCGDWGGTSIGSAAPFLYTITIKTYEPGSYYSEMPLDLDSLFDYCYEFPPPAGATGINAGDVLFYDEDSSGGWEFGEDVWYDANWNGVYDADTQINDGDIPGAPDTWDTWAGTWGTNSAGAFGIKYSDEDANGFWSTGDDTWVDSNGNWQYDTGEEQLTGSWNIVAGTGGTDFGVWFNDINLNGRYDYARGEDVWADTPGLSAQQYDDEAIYDGGSDDLWNTDIGTPGIIGNLVYFDNDNGNDTGDGQWDLWVSGVTGEPYGGEFIWADTGLGTPGLYETDLIDTNVYNEDLWHPVNGDFGIHGNLCLYDENGNGQWDFTDGDGDGRWDPGETAEAVWADAVDKNGVYDAALDNDVRVWSIIGGETGSQNKLRFWDEDADGWYDNGEPIWADTGLLPNIYDSAGDTLLDGILNPDDPTKRGITGNLFYYDNNNGDGTGNGSPDFGEDIWADGGNRVYDLGPGLGTDYGFFDPDGRLSGGETGVLGNIFFYDMNDDGLWGINYATTGVWEEVAGENMWADVSRVPTPFDPIGYGDSIVATDFVEGGLEDIDIATANSSTNQVSILLAGRYVTDPCPVDLRDAPPEYFTGMYPYEDLTNGVSTEGLFLGHYTPLPTDFGWVGGGQVLDVPNTPISISAGDVNLTDARDGALAPDLITTNIANGTVSIITDIEIDSPGNLDYSITDYNTSGNPYNRPFQNPVGTVVADYDGDGVANLVVADRYDVAAFAQVYPFHNSRPSDLDQYECEIPYIGETFGFQARYSVIPWDDVNGDGYYRRTYNAQAYDDDYDPILKPQYQGFSSIISVDIPFNQRPYIYEVTSNREDLTAPGTVTLTARGVGDVDGYVDRVEFYRDDGSGDFNPATDTLVGVDNNGSNGWTWNGPLFSTNEVFWVRAVDYEGAVGNIAGVMAVSTQVNELPVVESVYANGWYTPNSDVPIQGSLIPGAYGIRQDPNGVDPRVLLMRDSNLNGRWDIGEDIWQEGTGNGAVNGIYDDEYQVSLYGWGDGWTAAPGVPGIHGNLWFADSDGNGRYNWYEEIWLELGGVAGRYDAGIDTQVYGGRDGVWNTPDATTGKQGNLYFEDSVANGFWEPGEDVWADASIGQTAQYDVIQETRVYVGEDAFTVGPDTQVFDAGNWDPVNGAVGIHGNVYFRDDDADNMWDPGEPLWADIGVDDSVYDAGNDIIIDPATAPTDGDAGIRGNLFFYDADGDGEWSPGEDVWAAAGTSDLWTTEESSAGIAGNVLLLDTNLSGSWDLGEGLWAECVYQDQPLVIVAVDVGSGQNSNEPIWISPNNPDDPGTTFLTALGWRDATLGIDPDIPFPLVGNGFIQTGKVQFYRDSNYNGIFEPEIDQWLGRGTPALGDLAGYGTAAGDDWVFMFEPSASWTPGTQTIFVVAQDGHDEWSALQTARVEVKNLPPDITALIDTPDPVTEGTTITLTAIGVRDRYGWVDQVQFFRDVNGDDVLQVGIDQELGFDANGGDGWNWAGTVTWGSGAQTYFARALDNNGGYSTVVMTDGDVNSRPVWGGLLYPAGSTPAEPPPAQLGGVFTVNDGASGIAPWGVATADFNDDGKIDVATANLNDGTVSVLYGSGDGTLGAPSPIVLGGRPFNLIAPDLNEDGYPDLVVTDSNNSQVFVLLNDGAGNLIPTATVAVGNTPYGIVAGDWNGDGHQDVAVANIGADSVSILQGDGAGGLAWQRDITAGIAPLSGPYALDTADFDADGNADIVVVSTFADTATVLLGMGTGQFLPAAGSPVVFPGGAGMCVPIAADFDGDGYVDVAVTAYNAGDVYLAWGNGDGTFGAPVWAIGGMGTQVLGLAAGNMDSDNRLDLVITLPNANQIVVLGNQGLRTFSPLSGESTGLFPGLVTVADMNRDGNLDVVTSNQNSNTVTVLLSVGGLIDENLFDDSVPFTPLFPPVGDYDPVGQGEILTLQGTGLRDPDAGDTIVEVEFWRDSNGSGVFEEASDQELDPDSTTFLGFYQGGMVYEWSGPVTWAIGDHLYFVRALDSRGGWSYAVAEAGTVINPPPVITGGLMDTPDPVTQGYDLTLIAQNVTDINGTINVVEFYLDTNASGNLELDQDTLLGAQEVGVGGEYSIVVPVTWAAGTTTYFARAQDNLGDWSEVVDATGLVNGRPAVGSLVAAPAQLRLGGTLTLTATGVSDPDAGGSISQVAFYRDTNNNQVFDLGFDQYIGNDTNGGDGWSIAFVADSSTHYFFARAQDNLGGWSFAIMSNLVNRLPTVSSLTDSPDPVTQGDNIRLDASGVADVDGTVDVVEFYRDVNGNDLFDEGVDELLGVDSTSSDGWYLVVPVTWSGGTHTYMVRARDNLGDWTARQDIPTTDGYVNRRPGLTGLTDIPDPVTRGDAMTLTALGVADPDGTVQEVEFYRGALPLDYNAAEDTAVVGAPVAGSLGFRFGVLFADDNADGLWNAGEEVWQDGTGGGLANGDYDWEYRVYDGGDGWATTPATPGIHGDLLFADTNVDGKLDWNEEVWKDVDGDICYTAGIDVQVFLGLDGLWDTLNTTPGIAGNVYFADTGSGKWDAGEEIWADAAAGTAGSYDAIQEQRVYDGGDGWQTADGTSGVGDGPANAGNLLYFDSNGDGQWSSGEAIWADNPVLNTLTDVRLGSDTNGVDGWSLTSNTAGWPLGQFAYFARARDNSNAWGSALWTSGRVNGPPVIGGLEDLPDPVTEGETVTLMALAVVDVDQVGSVSVVEFWRDADGNATWDPNIDQFLGYDTDGSDPAGWSWTGVVGWAGGQNHTYFARARDNDGAWSSVRSISGYVNLRPTVTNVTPVPDPVLRGDLLTVTAWNVADPDAGGVVNSVTFYRSTTGLGYNTGDTVVLNTAVDGDAGITGALRFADANHNGIWDTGEELWNDATGGGAANNLYDYEWVWDGGDAALQVVDGVTGGIHGNLFWVDTDGNGRYDPYEEIWADDAVLGTAGVYDAGIDVQVYPGTDAAWQTPDGLRGVPQAGSNLWFNDSVDADGRWDSGEDVWADAVGAGGAGVYNAIQETQVSDGGDGWSTIDGVTGITGNLLFRDDNINGLVDGSEPIWAEDLLLLGTGTQSGVDWVRSDDTSSWPSGNLYFVARATDAMGAWSQLFYVTGGVQNRVPTIASLQDTPDPLERGTSLTLTAVNVGDLDGTVVQVEFYRDADFSGTVTGGDELLGTDTNAADGWSVTFAGTVAWPLGAAQYLAQAQDNDGGWSLPVLAAGTVVNGRPTITSIQVDPDPIVVGQPLTITALGVTDPDGTVQSVEFYVGRYDLGVDTVVYDPDVSLADGARGTWGNVYFRDTDADDVWDIGEPLWADIGPPGVLGVFNVGVDNIINPAWVPANGDAGTRSNVFFYDSNGDGRWALGEDVWAEVPVGTDNNGLDGWSVTIPSTAGWSNGYYRFLARASDDTPEWGDFVTYVTQANQRPVINPGQFFDTPDPLPRGDTLTLRVPATQVTDPDGDAIVAVEFYMDANGNGVFDAGVYDAGVDTQVFDTGSWDPIDGTAGIEGNVYFRDTNGNSVWDAGEPLWADVGGTAGVYNAGTDTVITGVLANGDAGTHGNLYFWDASADGQWTAGEDVWADDLLLGIDTSAAGDWRIDYSNTAGWALGTHTYFARAEDSRGTYSLPVSTTGDVVNNVPVVGTFVVTPNQVAPGEPFTLVASDVVDLDGTVQQVQFWRDADGNGVFDAGLDQYLGFDNTPTGGEYTFVVTGTASMPLGRQIFFARAQDNEPEWGPAKAATGFIEYETIACNIVNGAVIIIFDIDASNGVSAPNIAWNRSQYKAGTTDILIDAATTYPGQIAGIYMYGNGTRTRDIGIAVFGYRGLRTFSDARVLTVASPFGVLAVQGDIGTATFNNGLMGAGVDAYTFSCDCSPLTWTIRGGLDIDGNDPDADLTGLYADGDITTVTMKGLCNGDIVAEDTIGAVSNTTAGILSDVTAWNGGIRSVTSKGNLGHVHAYGAISTVTVTGGDLVGGVTTTVNPWVNNVGTISVSRAYNSALRAYVGGNLTGDVNVSGSLTTLKVTGGNLTGDVTVGTTLSTVSVAKLSGVGGSIVDSDFNVGDLMKTTTVAGNFTNSNINANRLTSIAVTGLVQDTDPVNDYEIHALTGTFTARDSAHTSRTISAGPGQFWNGVHLHIG